MTPKHLLGIIGVAALVWYFESRRARLRAVASSTLSQGLQAIFISYVSYLVIASAFNFDAYNTWSGFGRLLFFYQPTGSQFGALVIGLLLGCYRFFYPLSRLENSLAYRGGRRILCHKAALTISNSILAARAEEEGYARPQHLDPKLAYTESTGMTDVNAIEPIDDLLTNRALTPYLSGEKELKTVFWGMLRVPMRETERPFLVVGSSGSGKTLMIHGLMKSVLPLIKKEKNFRAFIYDDKPDFIPFARQLGVADRVWNFDPFAEAGVAWDIAADVIEYADALQVASVLAPVDEGLHEPYFQQSVQALLHAVLVSFLESGNKDWTLRDVLQSFNSKRRLFTVISSSPESMRIAEPFMGAHRSLDEVLASVRTKLAPYDIVAALWSQAKVSRSVREWYTSKTNAILLVTGRSRLSKAVKPINQALFQMASQLLVGDDDSRDRSTWIFLDEIREIGKLEDFHALANKGRSKGVKLVLGFQSITGMRAAYRDENAADELANFCGHKTFLNITCEKTREWAAKHVGTIAVDETVFSFSNTPSISWQTKREVKQAMEPSDFEENLRPAMPEWGFAAVNIVPHVGTYVSWGSWQWVKKNLLDEAPKMETPQIEPIPHPNGKPVAEKVDQSELLRAPAFQKLRDWDLTDVDRLGFPLQVLTFAFTASDIKRLHDLCKKVNSGSNKVAAFLMADLSPQDVELLKRYEAEADVTEAVEEIFVTRLNKLVVGPSIYEATRFDRIHLRPETKRRLARSNEGIDLMYLNRLLLEDAFSSELSKLYSQPSSSSGGSSLAVRRPS